MASKQRLYRIQFNNQGQVYEVYAREVSHGAMPGFLEVGKLVFGERSTIVVDPAEERLKTEFENVERFYVPVHAVIRVDEVSKQGPARILGDDGGSRVTPFARYGVDGGPRK